MAYEVGRTVEVCLEFDPLPARGVRRVVTSFVNEHGDVAQFTDVPDEASDCVLQESTQIGLRGRATCTSFYRLERLRVEHLPGVTHVDPPGSASR